MTCTPDELRAVKDHLTLMGEDASEVTPSDAVTRLILHGSKLRARHDTASAVMSLSADALPGCRAAESAGRSAASPAHWRAVASGIVR